MTLINLKLQHILGENSDRVCNVGQKRAHAFHRFIAKKVAEIANQWGHFEVVPGLDCGGKDDLQLFSLDNGTSRTRYCKVDLLIFSTSGDNRTIRGIVEIEESDFRPLTVCGKLLASALTSEYVGRKGSGISVPMEESVFFLEILGLKREGGKRRKTSKFRQAQRLETSLAKVPASIGSKISRYRLLCHYSDSFWESAGAELTKFLNEELSAKADEDGSY